MLRIALTLTALLALNPASHAQEADANTAFALEMYAHLAKDAKVGENVLFSPYSVRAAFAQAYGGAVGQTEQEIARVLHFRPQAKFHTEFAALTKALRTDGKSGRGEVHIANAMWAANSLKIHDEFTQKMAAFYDAGLKRIDFARSDAARAEINGWVAEQTKGKISDLLPEGAVDGDTLMMLVNAVYFKAEWKTAFEEDRTHEAPFFVASKDTVQAKFMYGEIGVRYAKTATYQAVELPYKGDKFSMVCILPKDHATLPQIEKDIANALATLQKAPTMQVHVTMPKHKLAVASKLKQQLQAMGMSTAFNKANFSRMFDSGRAYKIENVYHQATMEVDQKGTVAAAATAIPTAGLSGRKPINVRLDRPYLMLIREIETGAVLFMGKVARP